MQISDRVSIKVSRGNENRLEPEYKGLQAGLGAEGGTRTPMPHARPFQASRGEDPGVSALLKIPS